MYVPNVLSKDTSRPSIRAVRTSKTQTECVHTGESETGRRTWLRCRRHVDRGGVTQKVWTEALILLLTCKPLVIGSCVEGVSAEFKFVSNNEPRASQQENWSHTRVLTLTANYFSHLLESWLCTKLCTLSSDSGITEHQCREESQRRPFCCKIQLFFTWHTEASVELRVQQRTCDY